MYTLPNLRSAAVIVLLNITCQSIAQHPLDSWARRTVPGPNSPLNTIAYGNGTFVAVGNNSFVARSTDGVTWTTSTAGAYGTLKRVRFLNGQFLAVGSSSNILYSSDGASWTATTLPRTDFWDVAWGNGVYVIASHTTYLSSDGVNWVQVHPIIADPPPYAPYETPLDTILFANGRFVALPMGFGSPGFSRKRRPLSSTNGIDWVASANGQSSRTPGGGELAYQDGVWVSVTEDMGFLEVGHNIWSSTNNSAHWDLRFSMFLGGNALASGQGYFVVVSQDVASGPLGVRIIVSTNGFSWARGFSDTNGTALARGCVFGNGTFVAVGDDQLSQSYILQSGDISGAPIIFQEPQDRSAVVDNPVTFTVQAVGALPLVYQWYRDNAAISGATNDSYTIANVTTGDAGGYHVVVTNSINSVTSRVAQLTVSFLDIDMYAGIKILGVPGRTYRIDATPVSGPPNWLTVTNLVLPSNPYIWIDYESPTVPSRLYRAGELP